MMAVINDRQTPQLLSLLTGFYQGSVPECAVKGLSLHADEVMPGYVFFALAGTRVHGIEFSHQAIGNGACAIVWQCTEQLRHLPQDILQAVENAGVAVIAMPELAQQLSGIADRFYGSPSEEMPVVGITGTNGKTSCAHFIAQALQQQAPCAVIGTLGNGLLSALEESTHTTPDAIQVHELMRTFRVQGAEACAMEVSSHGLEQGRVAGVHFDVAVYTNISHDHLDYHGTMENYARAKQRLFEFAGLKHAVINRDDEFGKTLLSDLAQVDVIAYSANGDSAADLWGSDIHASHDGLRFTVKGRFGETTINTGLVGRFNVANLLAVLGSLLALGVGFEQAARRLEQLQTVPGRMQRIALDSKQLPLVVVDYAHTPDALESALLALREHAQNHTDSQGALWCVFGCGGDRDQAKRAAMGAAAVKWADYVVLTNDNPRSEHPEKILQDIGQGTGGQERMVIAQRRDAIAYVMEQAGESDVVLVAGKGHEQYQIDNEGKHFYPGDYAVCEYFLKRRLLQSTKDGHGGAVI